MIKHFNGKFTVTIFIFLILLTLAQITTRIFNNQLDFDEGYNLQIARNLHEYGRYATFHGLMDMNITTGPTVLFPSSLLYGLSHPTLPRVITALFSITLILFALSKYFSKRIEKIIFLILINCTPLFFLFSTVILGELPGFVFLFFSYLAFSRSKYFAAGMLYSLSILTKNVYILGFVPFMLYEIYLIKKRRNLDGNFKKALLFLAGAAIPIGLWETYKLWQFHFDLNYYVEYTKNLVSFTRSRGHGQFLNIERRLAMIDYTFHLGGTFFISIMLFVSSYVFIKSKSQIAKMLSMFTATYTLYFICFGATYWYRHFFPAILSLLFLLPEFLTSFLKNINLERKLLISTVIVVMMVSLISYKYSDKNAIFMKLLVEQNILFLDQTNLPYIHEKKILSDQLAMAKYISDNIHDNEKISGFYWLNSPEIAYLSGHKIENDPRGKDIQYVITSIYDTYLDPEAKKILHNLPIEIVYSNDSYTLYKKVTTLYSLNFKN